MRRKVRATINRNFTLLLFEFFWTVFSRFGLNIAICSVNLHIQSKYEKIRTLINSDFWTFLRLDYGETKVRLIDQEHRHFIKE